MLKPEVLTKATIEEIKKFILDNIKEYLSIGKLPIIQFLAEYNERKKEPSNIKIKTF